ncbi:MAG: TerB family tellurite resistance protein [Xanthomonadales bacterium]|jgi:tellurite resistance protein|nr:TerB family tellurite resistance protein [Xanthomonadales bacterium]
MSTEAPAHGVMDRLRHFIGGMFSGGKLEAERQLFIETLFVLLAQVARADGIVTAEEATFGERLIDRMQLSGEGRRLAVESFDRGRHQKLDVGGELARFSALYPAGTEEARQLFDFVIQIACIDGRVRPGERTVLQQITAHLGFPRAALDAHLPVES